jgi:hypothetical protein
MKEVNLPSLSVLAVGAIVMLLTNIIVEKKLMNGSVGEVVAIMYSNPEGPRDRAAQPAYVIVNFPDFETNEANKCFAYLPWTCVPISPFILRCEKKCCSIMTLPLCVCKAISIHKSQGLTVGPGKVWERVVIAFCGETSQSTPGIEWVAFSRATVTKAFAIYSDKEISMERLMGIGKSPANQKRQAFESQLHDLAEETQEEVYALLISPNPNTENPTFDRGFAEIVWQFQEDHLLA